MISTRLDSFVNHNSTLIRCRFLLLVSYYFASHKFKKVLDQNTFAMVLTFVVHCIEQEKSSRALSYQALACLKDVASVGDLDLSFRKDLLSLVSGLISESNYELFFEIVFIMLCK